MIVIECEGPSEVALINKLLDCDLLIFGRKEILDMRPIHFRQPKTIAPLINILPPNEEIVFYRIGDTQKEEFDLSCFPLRKQYMTVKKVCTKPEVEILIIINENLYQQYIKVYKHFKPKQFVKINVKNYVDFNNYIETHDLSSAITKYKKLKKHKKGEMYLDDILK